MLSVQIISKSQLYILRRHVSVTSVHSVFPRRTLIPVRCGPLLAPDVQCRGKAKRARVTFARKNLLEKFMTDTLKKKDRRVVDVWVDMTVKDFARALEVPSDDVFEFILNMEGTEHIEDDRSPIMEYRIFEGVAKKLRCHVKYVANPVEKLKEKKEENLDIVIVPPKPEDLSPRPPVVAIMGHIDHGKTTLLDYLRKSRIVEGEFGGITQHIGAFSVSLDNRQVTFIDTPGHAAFKAMRSRGALATDIVVLVVDVAEGVLEQTVESIRMIKEAGTRMIVALNKIDRPNADIEGTKAALRDAGVQLEDFGGDVQSVPISALKGTNIPALIEALAVQAEIMQLTADFQGEMEGLIIESTTEVGLGKTATVLVQRGSLKKGKYLVCGQCWAKVRKLMDDQGKEVLQATPSQAVKVVGWKEAPSAGDMVNEVSSERRANEVVRWRERQERKIKEASIVEDIEQERERSRDEYVSFRKQKLQAGVFRPKYGRHDFYVRQKESQEYTGPPKVSLIVKADVDGSLEAILNCIETYTEEDVVLDILDFGVGEVTETDFILAKQFGGVIYSFNTKLSQSRLKAASEMGVAVKEFNIIYKLIDALKEEISAKLPLLAVDEVTGKAKVLQEFIINDGKRKVPVAGCRIQQGKLERVKRVKVMRGDQVLFEGPIVSLKHLKEEVQELEMGKECGIIIEDSSLRFQEGDVIISYFVRYEKQFTNWTPGF